MGLCSSRNKQNYPWKKDSRKLVLKMKMLQQEIHGVLKRREEDGEAYERQFMLFAHKEANWKKERKKLRDEVKRLRKRLEEKEDRIRSMEEEVDQIVISKTEQFEGKSVESSGVHSNTTASVGVAAAGSLSLMEQIKEERARRDETAEKWKMLYLAIKNELDDLIHKTHQGTVYWRADEDGAMEELQRELKLKDQIIEVLKEQIAAMEDDGYVRKREVDILRQSLKIISDKKGPTPSKHSHKTKTRSKPLVRLNRSFTKLAFVN